MRCGVVGVLFPLTSLCSPCLQHTKTAGAIVGGGVDGNAFVMPPHRPNNKVTSGYQGNVGGLPLLSFPSPCCLPRRPMSQPPLVFVDSTPDKPLGSSVPFVINSGPQETIGGAPDMNGTSPTHFFLDGALPPLPEGAGMMAKAQHCYLRAKQYKDGKLKSLKPWSEFFDWHAFNVPGKMEAFSRANRNLAYFQSNYMILTVVLSSYILITNLTFLLAMCASASAYYYYRAKTQAGEPIVLFGRTLSASTALGGIIAFTLFLFYTTDGSSTVFWLVTVALIVVLGHAVARQPIAEGALPFFV